MRKEFWDHQGANIASRQKPGRKNVWRKVGSSSKAGILGKE